MTQEIEKSKEKEKKEFEFNWTHFRWFVGITLVIIVVIFASYYFNFNTGLGFSDKQDVWGSFGDFIGGSLNPILSFLAFIALLYTIVLQSRELKLTREELEGSKDALNNHNESLRLQNFENTFFKLLEIHLGAISNTKTKNNVTGLQCYKHMYLNLENKLSTAKDDKFSYKLANSYFAVYEMHKDEMSRFFNLHINLVDLINGGKEKKIKDYNSTYYMNIVRR